MIGERIKVARRTAGLSQRATAEKAGVSAQAISKYERGLDMPSSTVLLRLAPALNVRLDYLLRPAVPAPITLKYRKHPSLKRKQEDAVFGHVQDWLERYLAIEELTPARREFVWPEGFPRPVINTEDAERAAHDLRAAWQLGFDPIENMTELLEDQGIKVGAVPNAPDQFDACSFSVAGDGHAPVIAISDRFPGDRQRFSIAHELAQLVLDIPDGPAAEKIANRFAGALLIPESAARSELGESRQDLHPRELQLLKHKYGASMQCWIHRAQELGILPEATASRLLKQFRDCGWRETEPGDPYPQEKPTRMERLVLRALAEDMISEGRAAELLNLPLQTFLQQGGQVYGEIPARVRNGRQHLD